MRGVRQSDTELTWRNITRDAHRKVWKVKIATFFSLKKSFAINYVDPKSFLLHF